MAEEKITLSEAIYLIKETLDGYNMILKGLNNVRDDTLEFAFKNMRKRLPRLKGKKVNLTTNGVVITTKITNAKPILKLIRRDEDGKLDVCLFVLWCDKLGYALQVDFLDLEAKKIEIEGIEISNQ